MSSVSIVICATRKYTYAMSAQALRIQACLQYASVTNGALILVGDNSDELKRIQAEYSELLPDGFQVELISCSDLPSGLKNYEQEAQRLIAQMRTAGFSRARKLGMDYCWSLDSDVLPPLNVLRASIDALVFDNGYYEVACGLYPSQGGGPFLCGYGTRFNPIHENVYIDEREIPERYLNAHKTWMSFAGHPNEQIRNRMLKNLQWLKKRVDKYPPKGNVFTLNGKGWRRRGWFDYAYPSIGLGSMVPTNWCGFGCTLMAKRALASAIFDGYRGAGTEDLYICYQRWEPLGIRLAALPHCLCDHVIRKRNPDGTQKEEYIHVQSYHELDGPGKGHPRQRQVPFFNHSLGEGFADYIKTPSTNE